VEAGDQHLVSRRRVVEPAVGRDGLSRDRCRTLHADPGCGI